MSDANPYVTPTANVEVVEGDDRSLYTAYIGPKTEFYLPYFLSRLEGTRKSISWNWPAFFVTFYWMLHRRMYLFAFGYSLTPAGLGALGALTGSALFGTLMDTLSIAFVLVIMPMFANEIYFARARREVASSRERFDNPEEQVAYLTRRGGTSSFWIFLIILIPVIGILAAVALPAYQDYIRAAQEAQP